MKIKIKTIRPLNPGYIIFYVIGFFIIAISAWVLIDTIIERDFSGTVLEYIAGIGVPLIFFMYIYTFLNVRVVLRDQSIYICTLMWLKRGKKLRAIPIFFTSGKSEQRLVRSEMNLCDLKEYGFIKDLGLKRLEKPNRADFTGYVIKEIAFVMKDGSDIRLNAALYPEFQIRMIINHIYEKTGMIPTGSLAKIMKLRIHNI